MTRKTPRNFFKPLAIGAPAPTTTVSSSNTTITARLLSSAPSTNRRSALTAAHRSGCRES